jgi:hypothetical protein
MQRVLYSPVENGIFLQLFTMLSTAIVDKSENCCWLEALSEIVNVVYQECTLSGVDFPVDLGSARNRENSAINNMIFQEKGIPFLIAVKTFRQLFQNELVSLMHIDLI